MAVEQQKQLKDFLQKKNEGIVIVSESEKLSGVLLTQNTPKVNKQELTQDQIKF